MALVAIGGPIPVLPWVPTSSTLGNQLIDAAAERCGYVFLAPKTGTIDRICFKTNTVTTGASLDCRLETVLDTGVPSGSLVSAGANVARNILSTEDNLWIEVTLGTPAAVTQGQRLAVVVAWATAFVGNFATLTNQNMGWCQTGTHLNGAVTASLFGVGAVRYNDATYPELVGVLPVDTVTATQYANNSTPDERGNKFVPPVDCKVIGAAFALGSWADGDDFDVVLYDSGSSALATASVTGGAGGSLPKLVLFSSEITLAAGSTYRLVVKPTTTNTFSLFELLFNTTAKGACQGKTAWAFDKTTRTDAGAWTDDANSIQQITPLVSALDDGAGGGTPLSYGFAG